MKGKRRYRQPFRAMILVVLVGFAGGTLSAITVGEMASEMGAHHDQAWQTVFTSEIEALSGEARIAPATYAVALRAFAGQKLADSPGEAARFVFEVCLQADRSLRRGTPPSEVTFQVRRAVRLSIRTGNQKFFRENAQSQMRRQLSGMGSEISGDMEERPGPQSAPGSGTGPPKGNGSGSSIQGGSHAAESDGETGQTSR